MRTLVIIPAYNEEENIVSTVEDLRAHCPGLDLVVVNDGSADATAALCRQHGYPVLDLPVNLGIGGCVQTGETAAQGAVRELFEETGIRVTEAELECRGQETGADFIHVFFLVRKHVPVSGLHLLPGETDAAQWVQPPEYLRLSEQNCTIPLSAALLAAHYPDLFGE